MPSEPAWMPDGTCFDFWLDQTRYTHVLHVACGHPAADDANPGSEERPLRTISAAAARLEPGQKVVIHEGIYRESVRPARGGSGPGAMICYQAAPGERVEVRGSRRLDGPLRPSEEWDARIWGRGEGRERAPLWMADLPADAFEGYNPFAIKNLPAEFSSYASHAWTKEEIARFQLRRGLLFVDGAPLRQVFRVWELAEADGAFWVQDPGLRVHLRLPGDRSPQDVTIEYTFAEQLFAPAEPGLGYIRLSGLVFQHAADGIPVPQRSAVSTHRGHHWIVEDCRIGQVNATGLDIGNESWGRELPADYGRHVVRRNHIHDCGICGIAGVHGVADSLVEDNLIERIGGLNVEHIYECAGLKFHVARRALIRRNVFRRLRDACGLWLDVKNVDCRVTGNVFADIQTLLAGVYLECSHDRNLIDGNVFWDLRDVPTNKPPKDDTPGGIGAASDCCDNTVVAHNLFASVQGYYAVALHLAQATRLIGGRAGLNRRQKVLNNVFAGCRQQILLARAQECICDGNVLSPRHDAASLCIQHPAPAMLLNLEAWREYAGMDRAGSAAELDVQLDVETLRLRVTMRGGSVAQPVPVEAMHADAPAAAGPLTREQWRRLADGDTIELDLVPEALRAARRHGGEEA